MEIGFPLLRSFIAIVDAGTISGASETVYLSQPALSKQLKRLESAVGAQLLERGSRQVTLTEAGHELLPYARAALEAWEQGGQAVAAVQGRTNSTIRLGMHTAVGRGLIRDARQTFDASFPGWSIQVRQVSWDDPSAGLDDGQTDLAFRWSPRPDSARYEVRRILTDRVVLLVPDDHELSGRPSVTVAELAGAELVGMPPQAGVMRSFWTGGGRIDNPVVSVEAASRDEYFEAVASGAGLGLVPAHDAASFVRDGVTWVKVDGLPPCELYLIWPRDESRPVIAELVETFATVGATVHSTKPQSPG